MLLQNIAICVWRWEEVVVATWRRQFMRVRVLWQTNVREWKGKKIEGLGGDWWMGGREEERRGEGEDAGNTEFRLLDRD